MVAMGKMHSLFVGRLFPLGRVVMTAGVNERVATDENFAARVVQSMKRHIAGDWGDLGEEDCKENELSLKGGFRLLSSYGEGDDKIWIITEADRSSTCILFPSEY